MPAHPRFQEEYCRLTEMGLVITSKDQFMPWLWTFIHYFLLIITFGKMDNFRSEFTTTFGKYIVFYDGWRPHSPGVRSFIVLRHEFEHTKQYKKLGLGSYTLGVIVMGLLYLLVPLPTVLAWFRYYFERGPYLAGIKAWHEAGYYPDVEKYVEIISGPAYVWAWPFKKNIRKWLLNQLKEVL